jgi:hypothetical protein
LADEKIRLCGLRTTHPKTSGRGTTAGKGVEACCEENLAETFPPLLPGSEQFRLQQRRAIETSGTLLLERAFLQQSGTLLSEQEPSP